VGRPILLGSVRARWSVLKIDKRPTRCRAVGTQVRCIAFSRARAPVTLLRNFKTLIASGALLSVGAHHALAQPTNQTPLPPLTGTHSVGRAQFDCVDESRPDSTTPSGHREINALVWYPATPAREAEQPDGCRQVSEVCWSEYSRGHPGIRPTPNLRSIRSRHPTVFGNGSLSPTSSESHCRSNSGTVITSLHPPGGGRSCELPIYAGKSLKLAALHKVSVIPSVTFASCLRPSSGACEHFGIGYAILI